jgi:serine/threonine-protein kinase
VTIYRLYADDPPSSGRGPDRSPDAHAQAQALVGKTLASKYRLDSVVGSGGMGHVYRATNTAIGRTVAIKILRSEYAKVPEVVERFLREARTANRVVHPNVVDVTDIGQDADGTPFIVQEFLEGETLLDYAMRNGGKISLADLADVMGPVLSAVAEAHAVGIVHRDLKPENVFLANRRGHRVPKVLDFGISKAREADTEATKVGVMMGTPAYMPPELVVSFRDADARCDVWSLGIIVFEMLTGRVPFDGDTVGEVFHSVATKDADRLSEYADVPEALSDVVAKCLKRDPSERYPDAKALAIDLARAIGQREPEAARKWSLAPPAPSNGESAPPTFKDRVAPGAAAPVRGATVPLLSTDAKTEGEILAARLGGARISGPHSLASTLKSEPTEGEPAPALPPPRDTPAKEKVEERPTPRTEPRAPDEVEKAVEKAKPAAAAEAQPKPILSDSVLMILAAAFLGAAVAWFIVSMIR